MKTVIKCPTCQHDLLEDHGTTEDLDGAVASWGCVMCAECYITPESAIAKDMRFAIATTPKTMRQDIDQAWKQAKAKKEAN